MRTEALLRDTLRDLADQARTAEVALPRVLAGLPKRAPRRRRTLVVAAIIVVALAVAVPTFLVNRTAVPVDRRVKGNWNLIHRVDLPPGWEIKTQLISPDSESTSFGPVGATDGEEPSTCQVDLWAPGRGDPTAGRADRTPVTVNGRPAYYSDDSQVAEVWGVSWEYQPGAFAVASCGDAELAEDVAAAERVRLETVPVRLPFRLRSLPRGYAGQVLFPPVANSEGRIPGGVQFTAPDNGGRPYFAVVVQPGRTEIPPGLAGWETDTIKGVPAVLSARDARLCLNLDRHTACIEAASGEAADLTRSLWAAGRRELLVDVAERLVVAQDPDNPDTWFPADRAIPD